MKHTDRRFNMHDGVEIEAEQFLVFIAPCIRPSMMRIRVMSSARRISIHATAVWMLLDWPIPVTLVGLRGVGPAMSDLDVAGSEDTRRKGSRCWLHLSGERDKKGNRSRGS